MNTSTHADAPTETVETIETVDGPMTSTEVVPTATSELDSTSLKQLTTQLVTDVRPIVGRLTAVPDAARPLIARARPWADVFLPLVDEMRPLMDDLRPVAEDVRAISGEVRLRAQAAAARLDVGPVMAVARFAGAGARRVATMRPRFSAPSFSLPGFSMPNVSMPSVSMPQTIRAPRVAPSLHAPSLPIGALGSVVRRLRPGRWAFRTIAVTFVGLVAATPSLQQAMLEEISWTRSMVQTIELPEITVPAIELPAFEMPTIELPKFEMPAFELPKIDLPAFTLPDQGSATAPAKLAPAQFELPPLNAYRASFETQASYPTVPPNTTVEWVVALRNTGSVGWYRGVAGAQASLALKDGTPVAVQSTQYVGPGQVGWFVVHLRAPAGTGTHPVPLFPRIDGRGELPDLGIFTLVTVR